MGKIKFATRIPVFMYLTDYREETLKDVITQLEPGLFKKVTGLSVADFGLLVSLGVFNDSRMNDAVYKFRRYEDSSLVYTGINRHAGEHIGLFDTSLSEFDYMAMAQEESMVAPNGLASHSSGGAAVRWSATPKPASKPAAAKLATGKAAKGAAGAAKASPTRTPTPPGSESSAVMIVPPRSLLPNPRSVTGSSTCSTTWAPSIWTCAASRAAYGFMARTSSRRA